MSVSSEGRCPVRSVEVCKLETSEDDLCHLVSFFLFFVLFCLDAFGRHWPSG